MPLNTLSLNPGLQSTRGCGGPSQCLSSSRPGAGWKRGAPPEHDLLLSGVPSDTGRRGLV